MAEQRPPDVPPGHDNPQAGYERSDANATYIVRFGVGLVVFGIIAHLIVAGLLGGLVRRADRESPKLAPLAKQEREEKQTEAEKRLKKAVKDPKSSPLPEPPLVYERLRVTIPQPRLQVSDAADLEALRRQEDRKLRLLAGLDAKADAPRAEIERRVLEKGLQLLRRAADKGKDGRASGKGER
jgi:hypothetical protein